MATDYIDHEDLLAYLQRLFLVFVQVSAARDGRQEQQDDGDARGAETSAKDLLEARLTAEQLCRGFTSLPVDPPIHFSRLDFDTLVSGSLWGSGKSSQGATARHESSVGSSIGVAEFQTLMCAAVTDYVRRKLQRSVSETTTQEDFAQLAAVKILVADVGALNHRVSALAAALAGALRAAPSPAAGVARRSSGFMFYGHGGWFMVWIMVRRLATSSNLAKMDEEGIRVMATMDEQGIRLKASARLARP